jgi:hypothetical protein
LTTATTATVLDQSSDAAFRAWVAEVILQLVTTCGLTQTGDTGQINTATVTRAAINTAAGYVILRFNDTLQSTSAVFLKLEFGSAAATTTPQMWLTTGTGSNGSGTLTGTLTTRCAVLNGSGPSSTVTSFTSRFMYNATYGVAWLAFKLNANSTAGTTGYNGGFHVSRSNDASGAATSTDLYVITNSSTATGNTSGTGLAQCVNYASSTITPATPSSAWPASSGSTTGAPYNQTTTTQSGSSYSIPCYYLSGNAPNVTAYAAIVLNAETAVGSTMSEALVGSTTLTFINNGGQFGNGTSVGAIGTNVGFSPLWQ